MVGWCNDGNFSVFVDYMPELGDGMLIQLCHMHWLLIKVPHNCKVTTNIMRDYQLSTIIPIELVNFGFGELH